MLALVLGIALPGHAQGDSWQVTAVQKIDAGDVVPSHLLYAPDGQRVAFYAGDSGPQLCALDVTAAAPPACVGLPDDFPAGLVPDYLFQPLSWSPDSTRLAVVGHPLRYYTDTDLWIVDLASGAITNLADEGYAGQIFPNPPEGVIIDIQPTWSPDGTQIAVERTVTDAEGRLTNTTITLVDAATGAARDVGPLPGSDVYDVDAGSVMGLAWSPDQTTLAVSLRHQKLEPDFDGIWLLALETGEWTPRLSVDQAVTAFTGIYAGSPEILAAAPLSWSPDGSRLLFWTGQHGAYVGSVWPFWIDLATGDLHPLPVPTHPADTDTVRMAQPTHTAWSPDGNALLFAVRHLAALPDETVTLLDEETPSQEYSVRILDLATNQATLLGYLPLVPAELYRAVWGPDGNLLVDGYHLTITP